MLFRKNLKKTSLFCTKNAWKCALPLFWKESSSRSWPEDLAQPVRQAYDYWQELPWQETCCFARLELFEVGIELQIVASRPRSARETSI